MGSLPRVPYFGSKLSPQQNLLHGNAVASLNPRQKAHGSLLSFGAARQSVACSAGGEVLVFGEALFDCLADQKGVPREKVESWTPYPGGAPANVAAALGKLGASVGFITAFGNDELAKKMQGLLKERGVDLSGVQFVQSPTRDVLVIFDSDGDREFIGFGSAAADEFADCFISAEKLPAEKIQTAEFLVTGTLGLAYPETAAAMRKAVSLSKQGSCKVLIDVNWRPVFFEDDSEAKGIIFPYVEQGDILKMSDEEVEWLYGIPRHTALHEPQQVLAKAASAKGVLVTAGHLGCAYAFQSSDGSGVLSGFLPVLKVSVQDTTGAGDAFLAGFLFAMLQAGGLDALRADPEKLKAAVGFAAACGAFTTTQPGGIDAQPSEAQARELLASNPPSTA